MQEKEILKHFGKNVRRARLHKDVTLTGLAETIGYHASGLHEVESGNRWPRPEVLARLTEELGVSLDDLLKGDERSA